MSRESWRDDAACRGMDTNIWFPERGEPTAPAKAVCFGCPVRAECLAYALETGEKHGVLGGCSERERRAMRGQLRRSGADALTFAQRRTRDLAGEARKMRRAGMTVADIAQRLDVSTRAAFRYLAAEGAA